MWPIVAHNRYFSAKTVYAKQNGGSFNFVIEDKISVPVDPRFWKFLFQQSKLWGLATYEQVKKLKNRFRNSTLPKCNIDWKAVAEFKKSQRVLDEKLEPEKMAKKNIIRMKR